MSKGKDWEDLVVDDGEREVFEALKDPRWDFRTIDGIASSTKLDPTRVSQTIERYPDLIRRSSVPGPNGKDLFTLRKDLSPREALSVARGAISKSAPLESEPGGSG